MNGLSLTINGLGSHFKSSCITTDGYICRLIQEIKIGGRPSTYRWLREQATKHKIYRDEEEILLFIIAGVFDA